MAISTKAKLSVPFRARCKWLIALVAVLILGVLALNWASGTNTRDARTELAARTLLEFHNLWVGGGSDAVFSRSRWPTNMMALRMNTFEVSVYTAYASRREFGPLGVWWSRGYQIERRSTNDNVWAFYRVYSTGAFGARGLRWRTALGTVTNTP